MGEVKTSNDAGFTRSQPYGLGAGLERSSPPPKPCLCFDAQQHCASPARKQEFARRNNFKTTSLAALAQAVFRPFLTDACENGWFASAPLGVCPDCMSLHQPECFPVGIRVHGN